MKAVIDRFEGEYVVLDIGGKIEKTSRMEVPREAREGDVLVKRGRKWVVDLAETEKAKKAIQELVDELWED